MTELFRRQAVDFQRQSFHGDLVLAHDRWQGVAATLAVAAVAGLLALAATWGFARRQVVSGVLLPRAGLLRLVAPRAGVVLAGGAGQGQAVRAGDPVLRLFVDQTDDHGAVGAAVADALAARAVHLRAELRDQAREATQQAQAMAARQANLQRLIDRQGLEVAHQHERVVLAREIADRYPALVRSGAVSPVEASDRRNDLLEQQSREDELQRARVALQGELDDLRAEAAALPLTQARERSRLQRELESLAQEQALARANLDARIVAPVAGEIASLLVDPGQPVAAGQPVATLLPAGSRLEAELRVPSRAVGFVHPGTPVSLRVDAFPYERFGQLAGHVREVARSAVSDADLAATAGAGGPAVGAGSQFIVRVAIDAAPPGGLPAWWARVKPGMQVDASLVGDRRTLLQWVVEPLEALWVANR